MTDIILTAPLRGWSMPLDEVPDPVFAGRILGDGAAIDPTGDTLHAPCDGIVLTLHASHHAVTLRSVEGVELLLHVGIDTVALHGRGFEPLVAEGAIVQRGDPLIRFDLETLLGQVPALVTPVIITNPDAFEVVRCDTECEIGVGQAFLSVAARSAGNDPCAYVCEGDEHRRSVRVSMVHGIHARPAARIAERARGFTSHLQLRRGDKNANARSPVSLLAFGVRFQDRIEIIAKGDDAEAAALAIAQLIESGMGETEEATNSVVPAPPAPPPPLAGASADCDSARQLAGVKASPGLAMGKAFWLRAVDRELARDASDIEFELDRLASALASLGERLGASTGDTQADAIRHAHSALLDDPELRAKASAAIRQGRSADFAWRETMRDQAALIASLGDARLAERADDLLDLERQLLAVLSDEVGTDTAEIPDGCILLADDLLPSQLMDLDTKRLAGICTERGGPTSHVAILASSMGLPAIVAMGPALTRVTADADLIVDADQGLLTIAPDASEREAMARRTVEQARRRAAALARTAEEARTADGVRIEAFANLGSIADAELALRNGAEGCGLLRTEFLFLERHAAPDEATQLADYQAIAQCLDGRPLIVRLLDVGGDKPAPFLTFPREENPALGLRGIRVGLERTDLLETQLRAILRVQPVGQCRIMIPMVSSVEELRLIRRRLDQLRVELGIAMPVQLGVMIETPAAAITADLLAREADFLSIGSNDLTQYVLAMDRGNPAVASGVDGLHPAVLRMIAQTCRGAQAHGRSAGVCGGLASDPLAVPILIGLGVTELSATPAILPEIKAAIRAVTVRACQMLADAAVKLSSPAEVRTLANQFGQEAIQ